MCQYFCGCPLCFGTSWSTFRRFSRSKHLLLVHCQLPVGFQSFASASRKKPQRCCVCLVHQTWSGVANNDGIRDPRALTRLENALHTSSQRCGSALCHRNDELIYSPEPQIPPDLGVQIWLENSCIRRCGASRTSVRQSALRLPRVMHSRHDSTRTELGMCCVRCSVHCVSSLARKQPSRSAHGSSSRHR